MSAAVTDQIGGSPEGSALLCALFEHAQVGVVQVRSDGRLHWANATLCRMLGYNPKELIERNFKDLLASCDEDHPVEVKNVLTPTTGNHKTIEKCLLHRSGVPFGPR